MSDEILLKKFYKSILKLLQYKYGNDLKKIDEFKRLVKKQQKSMELLANLGMEDAYKLISALQGQDNKNLSTNEIQIEPIVTDYLLSSLSVFTNDIEQIDKFLSSQDRKSVV